ncbi:hypothetical protein JCM11641_006267 [Rhodosporidiobolus odoratus]
MDTPGYTGKPPRAAQTTLIAFILTFALFTFVSLVSLSPSFVRTLRRKLLRPVLSVFTRIPLPPALQAPSDLAITCRSFSAYPRAQQIQLDKKWFAFNRMPQRQRKLGHEIEWEDVLEKAEDALEVNALITDELAALAMEKARKEGVPLGFRNRLHTDNGRVIETLKHFVRDWSTDGSGERATLFPPVLDALRDDFDAPEGKRLLVPGCGLGRLAYEIACQGFTVDANDFSQFMNTASRFVFTRARSVDEHSIAPYIHSFSHQRSSENLLRQIRFPDVVPRKDIALNFVPGDFLELFTEEGRYDCCVTLFFIDTASNLVDYFETIFRALKPGGIWVNEGPLLYYGNPAMELPLEDVLRLACLVGFVVEQRRSLERVSYTADNLGAFTYDCEFWVARKPLAAEIKKAKCA